MGRGSPLEGFLLLNLGYPSGQRCTRPVRIVLDRQETPSPLRDGSHMSVSFHDTDQSVFRGDAVWPVLYHTCGVVGLVAVDFPAGQADRGPHERALSLLICYILSLDSPEVRCEPHH